MEMEVLHTLHGDKKRNFDTKSAAGRKQTQEAITKMLRQGTSIFLERGKKTYRVQGYDPQKDRLLVQLEKKQVAAKPEKGRKTAIAPSAGG